MIKVTTKFGDVEYLNADNIARLGSASPQDKRDGCNANIELSAMVPYQRYSFPVRESVETVLNAIKAEKVTA